MRRTTVWVIALVLVALGASAGAVALVSASPPDRDLRGLVVLTPAPTPQETASPSPPLTPPPDETTDEPEDDGDDDESATPSSPLVPVQPAPPRSGTDTVGKTPEQTYDDGMYHPGEQYDDGMYRPSDEYDDGMWTPGTGNG
ncbi:hypothetical protein [Oerskovia paurometabola]|uniref:hypothetical protein n=1 Tax=Oerskovia paurometabola TaxID=162170 RepID=UPI00341802A5